MKGIFTVVIFYYIKAIVAQDSCQQFPIPDHVYFDESSSTGSTIFISNKTNTTQQEWIVTTDLSRKINLTFSNQTYYIKLLTAIDLDVSDPIQTCDSALETFVERISCVGTDGQPVDKIVTFHLQPVNEYPPDVNTVPDINISEGNFSLPLYLYRLFDYFKDRDCPKERLMLSISDYSSKEKDVGGYFMVNNSTGYLYQVRHFDYEDTDIQCGLGKGGGFVNIRAEDGLHKTSKSLSVTFINIDDAPPVVVNSVCSTVCFTCPISSLSAFVHITHQGPIITDPPGVKAIDLDTKQSNIIVYTLDVYPTKYKDIIWFEDSRFVLLQSFANFSKYKEESDFTVIVTMQATGSNGQASDKFSFTIYVMVGPISSTSQQTSGGQTYEITILSQSTKDIIIIVLAVVVALLLSVILVYAVYRIRTHKKKTEDNETSYEEVKRNTITNENVYSTIQN